MFRLSTNRSCSGLRDHSSRVIATENFRKKKLNCQEIVMLHRMTTFLSTVVVAFLAAPVLNAAFPTAAQAAENCLARPTDNPSEGIRWYYQTNPVTGRKCWIIDSGKATVRSAALQGLFNPASSNERAEPAAAESCIKAPNGRAPSGKRWRRYTDDTTGQRCWQLSARVSRIHKAVPATRSPPIKLVAETSAVVLPRATANANARLVDKTGLAEPVAEPLGRIKPESSPESATTVAADEIPATSTFTSRWVNLWEQAHSSDRQPTPPGNSGIDQQALSVFHDVTTSGKTDDELLPDDRPLYLNLFILLAALGGALLLCGLTGGSFLYRRSASAVQLNLPPLPDALRVAEFDDLSGLSPQDTAQPLDASGAMTDSRPVAERDWQIAVDDLLREVGGDQIDGDSSRGQREAGGDRLLTNPFAGLEDRLVK
jgi:hypothetical protein